ncbi:MAG: asparagine--tRNA ligase [Spirochaetales bacterium]|nr:asparagine--tRNA ligase [Spirochaetales bacterium]
MRIKEILQSDPCETPITAKGWVKTKRDSKNVCFLEVTDGSTMKGLQVIIDKSGAVPEETLHRAATGASVSCIGLLSESPAKGQKVEMQASSLEIVGTVPTEDYPLQKKRHSFEFLRDIAHLRPRTNTFGAVARVRNAMSFAIHSFFQERGFLYVHTPIITGSDTEGAGQMFQVTTLDMENLPRNEEGRTDYGKDFFGSKTHMTVSGQLQVENYCCALGDVYTFGPTFRAENSNTTRHLAEFWMIEPEMAFCELEGNMELAEDFIKYILKYVLEHCAEDMDFFNQWVLKGVKDTLQEVIDKPFQHMTYTDAIAELTKANDRFDFKASWGCDLQTEHERYLTEEVCQGPVIVTDYPKDIKAFYMKLNDDGKTVRAMDVLVPRLGEIIGGSQREENLEKLQARMAQMDLDESEYWWYLELRRFGTVPHSGFGLGFERLIQYVTGLQNIRDVIPFPRTVKNIDF